MGRGLSDLQRFIVVKAATCNRLHYAEILVEYFGWKPNGRLHYGPEHGKDYAGEDLAGRVIGGQHFSLKEIGEKRYRKTMATLSRTCTRLGQRGLVTCLCGRYALWSGVEITDKGREWLMVNKVAT
jgi:hypothetical protein